MTWQLHVTVAAIVEDAGLFLMVEETCGGDGPVFNQPAGHLEPGETLQQAVVRETLEETGWHIRPEHFILVQQWDRPGHEDTYVRFVFSGTAMMHEPDRPLDPAIRTVHWLQRTDLIVEARRLRSPLVLQALDAYLSGRRHDLGILQSL